MDVRIECPHCSLPPFLAAINTRTQDISVLQASKLTRSQPSLFSLSPVMFSRLLFVVFAAASVVCAAPQAASPAPAASSAAPAGSTCNSGALNCCNSIQPVRYPRLSFTSSLCLWDAQISSLSSSANSGLLDLIPIALQGLNVPVGLTCTPINVLGQLHMSSYAVYVLMSI